LNSIKPQESNDTVKQKAESKPKTFYFKDGEDTVDYSEISDWLNNEKIKNWVQDQILSGNKVKVTCDGYAYQGEKKVTNEKAGGTTKELSKKRAQNVYDEIKFALGTKGITKKITGKGDSVSTDNFFEDANRRVDVTIENDSKSGTESEPKKENLDGLSFYPEFANLVDGLIIDETKYFDFIDTNYPNYFKTISQKIQYFQPGYHSTTPEGLNTRLTFLNQCMRQGPSINNDTASVQPQNLAFGRPPVCILRIGDFFHTKVIINSLTINYEESGIKWDLNPEGIGVQPMIANVSLTVDLIGGHSLVGPIDRLQNAISFNYYANTQLYDPRADKIDSSSGTIIDGVKLGKLKSDALTDLLKNQGIIDQLNDSETGDVDTTQPQSNIEIDYDDGEVGSKVSEIVIRVFNSEEVETKPSEVTIEGKVAEGNKLSYKVSVDGEDTINEQGVDESVTYLKQVDWAKGVDIVTPDESVNDLTTKINDKKIDLKNAQDEVVSGTSVTKNIKNIKILEKEIKELEKKIIKSKKTQVTVKVTAYFTKNKSGSTQVKEFTSDGFLLNL
jgi:hypothetical protein